MGIYRWRNMGQNYCPRTQSSSSQGIRKSSSFDSKRHRRWVWWVSDRSGWIWKSDERSKNRRGKTSHWTGNELTILIYRIPFLLKLLVSDYIYCNIFYLIIALYYYASIFYYKQLVLTYRKSYNKIFRNLKVFLAI